MSSFTTETSKLYPDISDILKQHENEYHSEFNMQVKLHTVEKDLDNTDAVVLNHVRIYRDYVENISDYIEVQLTLQTGTFVYDVYPHLDNIEVTLITHKQLYNGKAPFIVKERYKAVYLLDKNNKPPNTTNISIHDLNQGMPTVLTLQLLDRAVETIRVKTTQGNFHKVVNPKNKDMRIKPFFKSIISQETDAIRVENKKPIDLISIEEPDNKEELKSIVLPARTRIIEVPEYIQTRSIGTYNAGIGSYIQTFGLTPFEYKKIYYIYSLYDPKKFDAAEYKMMFYVPPVSSHSSTDITYKYEDKILRVLPHANSTIHDTKETSVMSTGSGYRTANANSYMKKPVEIALPSPIFSRNKLDSEVVYKDRADNLNFSPNLGITSNQFQYTSEVLKKDGKYITLQMANVDPDFIYPGPCKINFEDKSGKIEERLGVIHKAVIEFNTTQQHMSLNYNSKYIALTSHVSLQIFISN